LPSPDLPSQRICDFVVPCPKLVTINSHFPFSLSRQIEDLLTSRERPSFSLSPGFGWGIGALGVLEDEHPLNFIPFWCPWNQERRSLWGFSGFDSVIFSLFSFLWYFRGLCFSRFVHFTRCSPLLLLDRFCTEGPFLTKLFFLLVFSICRGSGVLFFWFFRIRGFCRSVQLEAAGLSLHRYLLFSRLQISYSISFPNCF